VRRSAKDLISDLYYAFCDMTHDAFISYSNKDASVAGMICASLEAEGLKCWMAPRDILPSENYSRSIVTAIGESRLVILVFSAASNESNHVESEIDRAYNKRKPIIPFRIEDVPLSPSLEYYLGTAQWQDAILPPLVDHIPKLVATVKLLLEKSSKSEESPPVSVSPQKLTEAEIDGQFSASLLIEPSGRLRFIVLNTLFYMTVLGIPLIILRMIVPFTTETFREKLVSFFFILLLVSPLIVNLVQAVLINRFARKSSPSKLLSKLGFRV
jgi:TIR domain